jgi:hypothetical protein
VVGGVFQGRGATGPKAGEKAQSKEHKKLKKQLFHLQAQRFESPNAARAELQKIQKTMKYHTVGSVELTEHIHYARKGRPTPNTPIKAIDWQIQATLAPDEEKIQARMRRNACFVVGTSIPHQEKCPMRK